MFDIKYLWYALAGVLAGIPGGMGMGGGTVLIPLLTVFLSVAQHPSQAVNLITFIPMAVVVLIFHIKNKLVAHKSNKLFMNAITELDKHKGLDYHERFIVVIDNIINQFNENKSLLQFIAKNLSWGIFKNSITSNESDDDLNFKEIYNTIIDESPKKLKDPEIMLFMIVELVSSAVYSPILYNEPVSIEELKPHLYNAVKSIIRQHECDE